MDKETREQLAGWFIALVIALFFLFGLPVLAGFIWSVWKLMFLKASS